MSILDKIPGGAHPERLRPRSPEPSANEKDTVCRNPRDVILARHRAKNGTINRELSALKRSFRLAERAGRVARHP